MPRARKIGRKIRAKNSINEASGILNIPSSCLARVTLRSRTVKMDLIKVSAICINPENRPWRKPTEYNTYNDWFIFRLV